MYSGPVVIMFLLGIQTKEKKRDESSQFSSSFMARGASASAFQSCPSDPILSGRYIANSRYVSIEAYPFALLCGEWIEGERIDACSKNERAVIDC